MLSYLNTLEKAAGFCTKHCHLGKPSSYGIISPLRVMKATRKSPGPAANQTPPFEKVL